MRPFQLRPFTANDIVPALELWRSTPGIGLNATDEPSALRTFLERNPALSQAAESDGRLVGAVLAGHDGRRGFLYHLAVRSEFRRRGIGHALVETALFALAANGITRATIHLFADNDEGKAFWRSTRWRERQDLVVVQKELTLRPDRPTP